jgi:hypothetical protein
LDALVKRRGQTVDLKDATLRPSRPVTVRVVGRWEAKQKEPWLLMTDIEETFRDEKDPRFGLALGMLKMTQPERLEKLLFIAALVHFIAMLVGGAARRRGFDRHYRANTVRTKPTHSDFTLGLYLFSRLQLNLPKLLAEFFDELEREFWG